MTHNAEQKVAESQGTVKALEDVNPIGPLCVCGHRRGLHFGGKHACDFYLERLSVCNCTRFRMAEPNPDGKVCACEECLS